MSTNKLLIIVGAIFGVLFLSGFGVYGYANSTRTEGVQLEQAMTAQYKMNQNELSTFVGKTYELMDIANVKSAKMDAILAHAVQGRYGPEGFKAGGAFYAAVQEAYPQLDLKLYDRVADAVSAGREGFKAKQDKLADMVRTYNTWRYDGIVRSAIVGNYFPSENLVVTLDGTKFSGKDALAKLDQMVLTEGTADAFKTGKMKPLDLKGR